MAEAIVKIPSDKNNPLIPFYWNTHILPFTVLGEFVKSKYGNFNDNEMIKICIHGKRVKIEGMTPDHVSLYSFSFPNSKLIPDGEYTIKEFDTHYKLPLLYPVSISYDDDEKIIFKSKRGLSSWFKLEPRRADAQEIPAPKLNYTTKFDILTEAILKVFKYANEDTNNIKMIVEKYIPEHSHREKSRVKIAWETGDSWNPIKIEEIFEPLEGYTTEYNPLISADIFERESKILSSYAPSYILSFLKRAKKYFDTLTFKYSENMPLHIIGEREDIQMEFWLAPMILNGR